LKYYGYKTAILSGGFSYYYTKELGIDYVHANELEIIDGKLTVIFGEIVDGKKKAEYLKPLQKEGIHINQTIVGDGANDLPMLNLAGLGIFSC
jgi:phosphoserine phosphatase